MKKIVLYIMLFVFMINALIDNVSFAQAFELREGDFIDDDEDFFDVEFESPDEYEEDNIFEDVTDEEYEDALDILKENKIDASFKVISSWQNHSNVEVTITNSIEKKIEDWEIQFDIDAEIENIWNAQISNKDNSTYTIKNVYWNQDIECGKTVSFGMTIKYQDNVEYPEDVYLTKEVAEVLDEYDVTYKEYSRWNENIVNGEITIHNMSNRVIDDWKLELESNIKIEQIWNAVIEESDNNYMYLNNSNHNAAIKPGETVSFGFLGEVDGEVRINEYYLYDMMAINDEETIIENEIEEGYERDEDEFDTETEYQAYRIVKSKLLSKGAIGSNIEDDKKGYALPVLQPKKVGIGDEGIEYKINGIKIEKKEGNNLKNIKATAIQSYAKLGEKYYIAQRKGDDIYISTCSIDKNDKKILNFDENSTMRLEGFAHGQTFEFVSCNNEMYMLLGTNVRKEFSQSLALVKYCACDVLMKKIDEADEDFGIKRITKLAYANQKGKYFAKVGRIDAALSADKKTLCVWFANDINDDSDKNIKTTKVQIACYKMANIINYFEKNPDSKSLSFKSMKKNWCNYSCEQNKKEQIIKPGGSNQGIEVSNTYIVKNKKDKSVKKNKVYFTSGDEYKNKPLYISMMTLCRNSNSNLTQNGSYRTQLRINPKKVEFNTREIEGLHIYGDSIIFIIASNNGKGTDKSSQYLCSIPKDYMKESNYNKRTSK